MGCQREHFLKKYFKFSIYKFYQRFNIHVIFVVSLWLKIYHEIRLCDILRTVLCSGLENFQFDCSKSRFPRGLKFYFFGFKSSIWTKGSLISFFIWLKLSHLDVEQAKVRASGRVSWWKFYYINKQTSKGSGQIIKAQFRSEPLLVLGLSLNDSVSVRATNILARSTSSHIFIFFKKMMKSFFLSIPTSLGKSYPTIFWILLRIVS